MANKKIIRPALWLIVFCALFASACSKSAAKATHDEPEKKAATEPDDAHVAHGEKEGKETSDLDRPLPELFAARCEHQILQYQCAECRYEVGVVRVPRHLIDSGLIKTAPTSKQTGQTALELTGEIVLDERALVRLSPNTSGVVVKALVDLGQRVKAGQPLILLRSAELAQAESDFLEAESRQKLAVKTHDRQKSLRESGVNSERELLEAEQELAASRIRVEAARQRLVNLGLTDNDIATLLQRGMRAAAGELVIRAPLSGVVLELAAAAPGVQLNPGDKAILIGDPTRLWLWADLYERDLPGVLELQRKGVSAVSLMVQAYPERVFSGKIDFIGSLMDEKTRTVKVRIGVPNADGRLHPGMFAKLRLMLPGSASLLSVPSVAVLSDAGRDFVFVRHDDEYFVRRAVVKGGVREGLTEITLGLDEGQTVVADGAFLLKSDVLRSKMGAGCAD